MSIVIAVRRPAQALCCLRALAADQGLQNVEQIAVCAADADARAIADSAGNPVVLVEAGGLPARRAAGIARARTDLVAVLSEDYRLGQGWAQAAVEFDPQADVLAGEVHPALASRGARRAAFCWEYLHWAPTGRRKQLEAGQARLAPAGAVIYRRRAVDPQRMAQARSELEYHAEMFAAGLRFVREPKLRLEYVAPELWDFLRLRAGWSRDWAHGHAEGRSTLERWAAGAARIVWPPVAIWRFVRRAAVAGEWRASALAGLPYALLFACAEGWGEARGYWGRRG